MADAVLDEWRELSEDFKKLETLNKKYLQKLQEVNNYQKECERQIQHQKYRISVIQASTKKNDHLKEEILKREVQLNDISQTLPQESSTYLKIILGNVNVSILNREDKLKYKSEYEKFKLIMSAVAFLFAVVNLIFISRRLERLYLFVLAWYYSTLTIRENILKVNGSRIKGWWLAHHYVSLTAAGVLLIWPEGYIWDQFRNSFMYFNVYLSFVQYRQFVYQQGVLYRLKALGERDNMDITIEGFHRWMWSGLSFLFPILFIAYFFQFYLACNLYSLSYLPGATWHVRTLSLLFFILSIGNITTMILIIPDKVKNNVKLKYQLLSQRLWQNNTKK